MLATRGYEAPEDLRRLCRFVAESPTSTLHAGDIQLMLSDPSFDSEREVRLWEESGQLVGFAFVRPSCAELIFEVKSSCARRHDIEAQMLEWAPQRMKSVASERAAGSLFFTSAREAVLLESLLPAHQYRVDA